MQRDAGDADGSHVAAGLVKEGQDHADHDHRDTEGLVRAWSKTLLFNSVIFLWGLSYFL